MTAMPHEFHGYAIVSADDMIADAAGHMPDSLKSDADWRYFQSELDLCRLVLLGRVSHEIAPNPRGRRRLVVSATVTGLVERPDAWWWNPAAMPLDRVLARLLPEGGRIGVPGGQGVFDIILGGPGFDAFHLSRIAAVNLPGGRPVFGACAGGSTAEGILAAAGMVAGTRRELEPGVAMQVWHRP